MILQYALSAYERCDQPDLRLVNLFSEKTPANRTGTVLLSRPALTPLASVGTGPIRGLYAQAGSLAGARFAVSGEGLYSNDTMLGAIPGDDRVVMASTPNALLIANGTGLYRTDGTTLSTVAFPDNAGACWVGFIGGYAFAVRSGTRRIYFTLDPTTWDGLDYISAEQTTANIVGAAIVSDQIWVFSEDHTEIFTLTGDADTPIQRVQGRLFDKGARTRDSIANLDNSVFWVGNDGIVYRGDNAPLRASTHAIEESIAGSTRLSAWAFPWFGHLFYILHTDAATFAYDAATLQWCEMASYGRETWRAALGDLSGADVIVGDDETGQVWRLDNENNDAGDPLERRFTCLVQDKGFLDNVILDCSRGITPLVSDPPGTIELRTSRDGGKTFNAWRGASLGKWGASRVMIAWRRLGIVDHGGLVMEFRVTDNRISRISTVRANEAMGGRSR